MSIQVSNFSYQYVKNSPVLENINFKIESGNYVCLLGPNGVGKSTLFKCMLGLMPKYKGNITIAGKDIKTLTPKQLARKVAYIPQSTSHIFNYSVSDVVLMGTTSLTKGIASPGANEVALVDKALKKLNIDYLRDRMFLNLSGGERQLVLIARALVQKAKILFLDEPTANLDYGNQVRVLEQIKKLVAQGYTVIQSTHNPDQAFMYADKVLAIKNKRIVAFGSPNKVMNPELMQNLYNVDVLVEDLYNSSVRVCIPKKLIKTNAL